MKYGLASLVLLALLISGSYIVYAGTEADPCKTRVPADQLAAAKAEKNAYVGDAAAVAEGKSIFEGKGTCFTCHGLGGKGDGDAGKALDPTPRNFTNAKFHACKTDGEMLYVIRNGSPGTAMIPAVQTGILTDDEAKKVQAYERTFSGK
ncbi:MAG TPA: c-type cytochrome [Nitrospiria bacterium]|nr:c-type cytochrome [Nitrospiria bacterium]